MMQSNQVGPFILAALLSAPALPATPTNVSGSAPAPRHRMLLLDEGNSQLHLVDENGGPGWTSTLPGNARDLQWIGGGRALAASLGGGYFEIGVSDGVIRKQKTGFGAVQSARRLADGHTLLAGDNLDGSPGIVVLELDAADKQIAKTVFPGMSTLRLLRLTKEGHLLFGSNSRLIEADRMGNILWEAAVPGAVIFKALRIPNGNTWVSTGYSATLTLIAPDKTILRALGGTRLPAETNPHFFADFQILPNGNLVVANWQNHGPGHGAEGIQVIEMDTTGKLVWQYKQDPARISSLHGVLILDGLDTGRGYDEPEGVQAPWTTTRLQSSGSEGRRETHWPWPSLRPDGRSIDGGAVPFAVFPKLGELRFGSP